MTQLSNSELAIFLLHMVFYGIYGKKGILALKVKRHFKERNKLRNFNAIF